MRETAFAKINLALHVRERLPDGFHRIETIFAFAEDGDTLSVAEGEALSLAISGPFASGLSQGEDNLVVKAARALAERFDVRRGVDLRLVKRLPVAAGIGGGSADAAAALRLLVRWWDLDPDEPRLLAIARKLGADVPACLFSRLARGEGRGDELQPLDDPSIARIPLLLVNPGKPVSTAAVFRAWDGLGRGRLNDWRDGGNDLEPPALRLVPEIADVLGALSGALVARMSGSGATCFGLYADEEDRDDAAAEIASSNPHWWTLATRLR